MNLLESKIQNSFDYIKLLKRIVPFIKPYMFRISAGFLISIPAGAMDGLLAFSLKPYLDYAVGGNTFNFTFLNCAYSLSSDYFAAFIPAAVIIFAAVQGVLRYLNSYITDWTSLKITNGVKLELYSKLVYMDASFFDKNNSGILLTRYLSDSDRASAGIVNCIKSVMTNFAGAMSLIFVMIYNSPHLAFIGVVVLCTAFIPTALIRKKIRDTANKSIIISGNIATNFNETYNGNRVMRAYSLENSRIENFKSHIKNAFENTMSLTKRAGWMSPLMYLIASAGIAVVLSYGTYLINIGQLSPGGFASFITSLLLLYKPIKGLGSRLTGMQWIFTALSRIFELFDLEPNIKDCKTPSVINNINNSIEFRNVSFGYKKNHYVLKDINLTVKKGETVAIVGSSGGGKSTLVNLIPRFYDVVDGEILIDGTNIKNIKLESLRKNISMVFQDNFLFSGTIKENICAGNPYAAEKDYINAINAAHLDEVIECLPDKEKTVIGERGMTLSGGQRQRIAIARAIIKDSPVIILDEATSSLDNKSELVVQKALENLIKNKTVFIIAHRLSTIQNADRIIVLNNGEIAETGSHDELMSIENGQYKMLYETQFKPKKALA